jgi:hypothetical protein
MAYSLRSAGTCQAIKIDSRCLPAFTEPKSKHNLIPTGLDLKLKRMPD